MGHGKQYGKGSHQDNTLGLRPEYLDEAARIQMFLVQGVSKLSDILEKSERDKSIIRVC